MNKPLYILDLDRTTFDTSRFANDLTAVLRQTYQLDRDQFDHQLSLTYQGELGADYLGVAARQAGRPVEEIVRIVLEKLGQTDYCYPDVEPWLKQHGDAHIVIVTVGHQNFQSLKLAFAPPLSPYKHIVIQKNKGRLIREILTHDAPDSFGLDLDPNHTTIVDDNPQTFVELEDQLDIKQIYLARPHEKYAGLSAPSQVQTITTFGELK